MEIDSCNCQLDEFGVLLGLLRFFAGTRMLITKANFKREKEKGKYNAKCLSTRHIKVAIGTAERRIKGDIPRMKIEVVV